MITISSANNPDATKFVDVMESISDYLYNHSIEKFKSVYADHGYDSRMIRDYLKSKNIIPCIPKRNFKTKSNQIKNQNNHYNKTRFTAE